MMELSMLYDEIESPVTIFDDTKKVIIDEKSSTFIITLPKQCKHNLNVVKELIYQAFDEITKVRSAEDFKTRLMHN